MPSFHQQEPIAIIGAGCRLPGSSHRPSKLWELLQKPSVVAVETPADRFSNNAFYHPDGTRGGSTNVRESYFITDKNIRHFDAQFFSFHTSEAEAIDPQHRHLLEIVYEALEDAGLSMTEMQGSNTAVFVGQMCNDYSFVVNRDFDQIPKYGAPGLAPSNASSRVSYFFDWHGPTMTIDTACSSSLVALNQAVQALRDGTSDIAVAAGTNLILDPVNYITESNIGMLSPTGRSRMWDIDADGYARGEGVVAIVLKPLSAALRDGDTIDSLIRSIGCNHDGKTQGLTVPSGVAQAALIRDTYIKAGLDPSVSTDRCQYFEAHGTGTPAGDPQEALALDRAFFPADNHSGSGDDVLYVGSIKTVVGHTEGTAGLAGVLKAVCALKCGIIPPNLLLNRLSPTVEPYYRHLRILNESIPWPVLPDGVPRRASVNSFGFGGSNAHVILEAYQANDLRSDSAEGQMALIPFVFSANSESSLISMASSYASYLQSNQDVDLDSLRYTLSCRRSTLPHKVAFSAATVDDLLSKMENLLGEQNGTGEIPPFGLRSLSRSSILGVFTGQGAQWPKMGSTLISCYPHARQLINELDKSLQSLPELDKPHWRILDELSKDKESSRIGEAALSQPLCTAVQLVLVDLLRSTGIKFDAVVGHSSGEIAAAYTAGFLSSWDAIRIAYYRGLHAKSASGPGGRKGSMMAVGTSLQDAEELCGFEEFEGRLCVAASNSPSSVTIAGDHDAIEEAKEVLVNESKFTRILQVDTAYHSHHMTACASAFQESLLKCNIRLLQPDDDSPNWISSVQRGTTMLATDDAIKSSYWADNMTNTVLFREALEYASEEYGPFHTAVELGPHPALKGPAVETLQGAGTDNITYLGTLNRGNDDISAISGSLGTLWMQLGSPSVEWTKLIQEYCQQTRPLPPLRDLPLYPWDHVREYWAESRLGKQFRLQKRTIHELLGQRMPDGTREEVRWKNVLNSKVSPWLTGHAIQGQMVYPAAGYAALATEAAAQIAQDRGLDAQSVELTDFLIGKAIAIDPNSGAEIVVSMTGIVQSDPHTLHAQFACYSPANKESLDMVLNASTRVQIVTGVNGFELPRQPATVGMSEVDVEDFYKTITDAGYNYTGVFKGISSLKRRHGFSFGTVKKPDTTETGSMLFHPALLDNAFHGAFASFRAPGDDGWSLRVPLRIKCITIVLKHCGINLPEQVEFDCRVTSSPPSPLSFDIDVIAADGVSKCIEVETLEVVPFAPPTEADDRLLFSKPVWKLAEPNGDVALGSLRATAEERQKGMDLQRLGVFYLRNLIKDIDIKERESLQLPDHHQSLFEWATYVLDLISQGEGDFHHAEISWFEDSLEDMMEIRNKYPQDDVDICIMCAVGENLPAIIRNEITVLEIVTRDDMINRFYEDGIASQMGLFTMKRLVQQITARYPRMDILEIGAGTGGATRHIADESYSSYTYTDISSGFFTKAQDEFKRCGRMIFKTLDIEKSPKDQNFEQHSYDLIVASNVLHATANIEHTLRNVRSLLKPGGYLVMMEIVQYSIPSGVVLGAFPGWWIGKNEGRKHAPTLSMPQWDKFLQKTGFAGIDTYAPLRDPLPFITSSFVAQAVNDDFNILREPTAALSSEGIHFDNLILLGGDGIETGKLANEVLYALQSRCKNLTRAYTLEDLDKLELHPLTTVVSLLDLDDPLFRGMNEARWASLQKLIYHSGCFLWMTHGSFDSQPDAAAMIGLIRTVRWEHGHLRSQVVEVENIKDLKADILVKLLLRLRIAELRITDLGETGNNMLWTNETELLLQDGHFYISRQIPDTAPNDRYNSAIRTIRKNVDLGSVHVALKWDGLSYSLRETTLPSDLVQDSGFRTIRVDLGVLSSIRTPEGFSFLSLGTDCQNSTKLLVLSDQRASTVIIPSACTVPVDLGSLTDGEFITLAASYLTSQRILNQALLGWSILVHEPPPLLAAVLQDTQSRVYISTTRRDISGKNVIYISPETSRKSILRSLPSSVDILLDFSGESALGQRIAGLLGRENQLNQLLSHQLSNEPSYYADKEALLLSKLLQDTTESIKRSSSELIQVVKSTSVGYLTPMSILEGHQEEPLAVVQWQHDEILPVILEPVDSSKRLFQDNKTYWMVGLAGDLGQSICDWMIEHGARYIVLTSRTPRVPKEWIESHTANGITIQLVPGDIINMKSLTRARIEIEKSLPKIAGVANGALILHDKLFMDTDHATFQSILRPKTTGTFNLDKIFYNDKLDWFISFSSVVSVCGNVGQSGYVAANCYMKAVMNRRRQRGLAAFSIDIAKVVGVGYVEREKAGKITSKMLGKLDDMVLPISESDLHQLFAEAVIATQSSSDRFAEITSGVRPLRDENKARAFWSTDPRFSHFILPTNSFDGQARNDKTAVPVRKLLLKAKTASDVTRIIQGAFVSRLNTILQQPADQKVSATQPLIDLGIDSLIAVEIRTWFLQELGVEIPVLKLLGGATLSDLAEHAASSLPENIVPDLQVAESPSGETSSAEAESENTSQDVESTSSESSDSIEQNQISTPTATSSLSVSEKGELNDQTDVSEPEIPSSDTGFTSEPEIVRTEIMSYGQARFWLLHHSLEDRSASNIVFYFHIFGHVDAAKLDHAFNLASQRHESLRTRFFMKDQKAWQGIMKDATTRLESRKARDVDEVRQVVRELQNHEFDLEGGNVFRLILCEESPTSFYFIVGYNHIILDAHGWNVLFAELLCHYQAIPMPPVAMQYPDWALYQRAAIESSDMDQDRDFWRTEFASLPPVLPLFPMSHTRTRQLLGNYHDHRASSILGEKVAAAVKDISSTYKVSVFHFYLTIFRVLLSRLTDSSDICIGMTDANRMDSAHTGIVGLLLNIVPLRFEYRESQKFTDTLRDTRKKVYAAISHGSVPFDVILGDLIVPRASGHHPLFQAFIDYQVLKRIEVAGNNWELPEDCRSYTQTACDIALHIYENQHGIVDVSIGLKSALYSQETTDLVLRSYITLLEAFARSPSSPIQKPSLYSTQDLKQSVEVGAAAPVERIWPGTATVSHRIDAIVAMYPDSIALKERLGYHLSYSAMAQRVEKIQAAMLEANVGHGSIVAVFQQPGADWICSMLAVMRLGAVYLPLDNNQGLKRLSQIAESCPSLAAILVDPSTVADASAFGCKVLIDICNVDSSTQHGDIPNSAVAENPAVVLFTSGTTGTPKGITLRHSGILNAVEGLFARLGLGREKVLQHTAYNFDMSLNEIFVALCNGGTLLVADRAVRGDSRALMELIMAEGVTYTKATPPQYSSWIQHGGQLVRGNGSWKYMVGGGDRMTNTLRREVRSLGLSQLRLFNAYGPAEATLSQTTIEVPYSEEGDLAEPIPVGKPLPNYIIYIVDDKVNLLPPGVPGEIVIGGPGIGIGYLGDADMTDKKFLDNPWLGPELARSGPQKMYRTGDRGFLDKQGQLVFLGRVAGDTQIKLRGIRMELGDIESTIVRESDGEIHDAICIVPEGADYLVAHVVFSQSSSLAASTSEQSVFLDRLLSELSVPQHMKPAVLIPLSSLPLADNRKIDRAALAALPVANQSGKVEEDEGDNKLSELESVLAGLWKQVLSSESQSYNPISRSLDFYRLGGSSLSLIMLQDLIRKTFTITIPFFILQENITLGRMAAKIVELQPTGPMDWDSETAPPMADEIIKAEASPPLRQRAVREVILTGSTGHIGQALLKSLLANPDIVKVHCIAIRDPRKLREQASSEKIAIYQGDLTAPALGLDPSTQSHLASVCDSIIHAGADRKFWSSFAFMRVANVGSTRELLRLAAARRVPIHFLSSGGVFPHGVEPTPTSVAEHTPDMVTSDGYIASKWASERMLERAEETLGVPSFIYRTVHADEVVRNREPPEGVLEDMIRASVLSMTIPDISHEKAGWIDLVARQEIVGDICNNVMRPAVSSVSEAEPRPQVLYHNFRPSHRITTKHMEMLLQKLKAQDQLDQLKPVSVPRWLGAMKRVQLQWVLGAVEAVYNEETKNRR